MKAKYVQYVLAFIFVGLGGWCILFPGVVERLGLNPEYYIGSDTSAIFIACFGAQAVLTGIVIATSRFEPETWLIFGVSTSVPFFIFNIYFYYVKQVFTDWMILDFVGNISILTLSIYGYRVCKSELTQLV